MLLEAIELLGQLAIQCVAHNSPFNHILVVIISNISTDAFPFASPSKVAVVFPARRLVVLWITIKETVRNFVVFILLIFIARI
jgi:hypothetical protein